MKTKEYEAIFRNLMITKHPKAFKDGKYLNISSFDLNVLPMPYYNYL